MYSDNMNTSSTLLGLIAKSPSYGYDLKQEYDRLFSGEKPLAYGQVYATLSRLARDDQVKISAESSTEGPDRKKYQITEFGRQKLEDWLLTPEMPQPKLQAELFTKVVLALMLKKDAAKYLDVQRQAHMQRMREITKQRRQGDLSFMLLADHAIYHIEADLKWIDLTESRLLNLKKELAL
ncbi:MAG: PadR family transcriptional regulator [Candidatus Saccharibacteria bacterium]|nr:PadR family transcriptional regulator [Candidatus Saccharibacteria bacterium]